MGCKPGVTRCARTPGYIPRTPIGVQNGSLKGCLDGSPEWSEATLGGLCHLGLRTPKVCEVYFGQQNQWWLRSLRSLTTG
jgi:hypothetical protein